MRKVLPFILLLHLSYLHSNYLWLEHNDIERRAAILPLSQISRAFTSPFGHTSFYRPAVTISYSFDSAIYGQWLPGFRLTSIFLHLVVAALAPLFLSIFFSLSPREKLLTTLIIGVHPITSPVVGFIFQRQESLVLIGIMLTLYFYSKTRSQNRLRHLLLFTASLALGIFSKETALIIIPALILIWEITTHGQTKKGLGLLIPTMSILIAIYALFRLSAVPQIWGTKAVGLSLSEHIGTRLGLVSRWLFTLITPLKPKLSDVVPVLKITDSKSLLSLFLLLVSFVKIKNRKFLALFLILLAPGLNLIPVPRIGSPHYAYLPLIPFALGLVWASRRFGRTALYIWLAVASVSTFFAGFQYKNDLTLFTPEVAADPDFAEGHFYLGNYYLTQSNLDKAGKEFTASLKNMTNKLYYKDTPSYLVNLAGVRYLESKLAEADQLYHEAEKIAPPGLLPYISFNRALITKALIDQEKP